MLSNLYICNLAVIEKVNIDFSASFNVLTGETGAGKSIVIDSINAVTGHRMSKDIIRTGEKSAYVCATFTDISDEVLSLLDELGFYSEDNTLIISRELFASGKNVCRINDRPTTVATLREIGIKLINIHGQHECLELMDNDNHISYIDNYGGYTDLLSSYKESFNKLKSLKKQVDSLNDDEEQRLEKIDLYSFQVKEIEDADLENGEEDALKIEREKLRNSDKISRLLKQSYMTLSGDDDFTGATNMVETTAKFLLDASSFMPELEKLADNMYDISYSLQDMTSEISSALDNSEFDPQRLEEIEERLDVIDKVTKKYGRTIDDTLEYLHATKEKLSNLIHYDRDKSALLEEYNVLLKSTKSMAKNLHDIRLQTAETFANKVKNEMVFMDMPNVTLSVEFTNTELSINGTDNVEFLISANPGETPKPVSKIASGGELSRMMLAIKTVLASCDTIDTLIFDEIDTGISGKASYKVGLKLKEVGDKRQVLTVTHQPQIAALGDTHLLISKKTDGTRTYTDVNELDKKGRITELARMMGGSDITENTLLLAKEMLDN